MRKLCIIPLIALSLSSCASFLTPERCDNAIRSATTAEQIAAILVNSGLSSDRAMQFAKAIMIGRLSIIAACEAANNRG